MIKGTNIQHKNAKNRLQEVKNGGFVRLFILLILLAGIMLWLGIDPKIFWEKVASPVFNWILNATMNLIEFLYNLAVTLVSKARDLLGT